MDDDAQPPPESRILQALAELNSHGSGPKKKDAWDKGAVVASALASVTAAVVAASVTYFVNRNAQDVQKEQNASQLALSKEQIKLANTQGAAQLAQAQAQAQLMRQNAAMEYLKVLGQTENGDRRAALLGAIDIAITDPSYFVPVACFYARSENSDAAKKAAFGVLSRCPNGRECVAEVGESSRGATKANATGALLSNQNGVRLRISHVDDIGEVRLNSQVVAQTTLPNETGWIDITKQLKKGENNLVFTLTNGIYGGWSFQLQLIAGRHNYDSGIRAKNECPCNKPVLSLSFTISVADDGKIDLTAPVEQYFPA
jgi:hypothetical protein